MNTNLKDGGGALVRTSILVTAETDRALRQLAEDGKRPLSWEIRQALEDHVAQAKEKQGV